MRQRLDDLTDSLNASSQGRSAAIAARQVVYPYDTMGVDIAAWLDALQDQSLGDKTRNQVQVLRQTISNAVIANYSSAQDASFGLAVLFPANAEDFAFLGDDRAGYKLDNTFKPIKFVRETKSAPFLRDVFKIPL